MIYHWITKNALRFQVLAFEKNRVSRILIARFSPHRVFEACACLRLFSDFLFWFFSCFVVAPLADEIVMSPDYGHWFGTIFEYDLQSAWLKVQCRISLNYNVWKRSWVLRSEYFSQLRMKSFIYFIHVPNYVCKYYSCDNLY